MTPGNFGRSANGSGTENLFLDIALIEQVEYPQSAGSISALLLTDPRGAYGGQAPGKSNKSGRFGNRPEPRTPASLPPMM